MNVSLHQGKGQGKKNDAFDNIFFKLELDFSLDGGC